MRNSKQEARNTKQYQNSNVQNYDVCNFEFKNYFEFRIYNLGFKLC